MRRSEKWDREALPETEALLLDILETLEEMREQEHKFWETWRKADWRSG